MPVRDEAEHAMEAAAEDVAQAVDAMREVLRSDPDRAWWPDELRAATRHALRRDRYWSPSIVVLAFAQLVEGGVLEIDDQFLVRAVKP